jgi:hypothetical protein
MDDDKALGYAAFWKRVSIKLALSQAAKEMGDARASQLSAFEQGKPHTLTPEQIQAYLAYLDRKREETPPPIEETPALDEE